MTAKCVIVVGAGSVGCVVAMRLARDFGMRVTLCEPPSTNAAVEDRQRPARWLRLFGSSEDYQYATQPNANLAGRAMEWPRGRGLGGSSRINAMIWHQPTDTDAQMLARASENAIDQAALRAAVSEIEALVQPETPLWLSPSGEAFMSAVASRSDESRDRPTIYRRFNRNGQRWTAANLLSLTAPGSSSAPGSLEVVRGLADQVIWKGDRAVGVRMLSDGVATELRCDGGVVLCAGTLATPSILVRSGIGPRATLKTLSIPRRVVCDAVGRNLQDHLVMPVIYESTSAFTDSPSTRDVCRWQVCGSGPLASNLAEWGGIYGDGRWQLHVTPTHYLKFPHSNADSAMTVAVNATRPQSRGSVCCMSPDPTVQPLIDPNYLSESSDLDDLVEGVKFVRQLANDCGLAKEILPGKKRNDRASLAKSIRRYSQTLYHPVGTCAFGGEEESPVQPDFRVRGCDGLWVADASVLPVITQGNPSVTLMALGWISAQSIAVVS